VVCACYCCADPLPAPPSAGGDELAKFSIRPSEGLSEGSVHFSSRVPAVEEEQESSAAVTLAMKSFGKAARLAGGARAGEAGLAGWLSRRECVHMRCWHQLPAPWRELL
jgi:hypothetical protein